MFSKQLVLALLLAPAALAELSFAEFKAKWSKTYESAEHEAQRADIFLANVAELTETKAGLSMDQAAVFGVTKFFDLTKAEFARSHLNYHPIAPSKELPVRNQSSVGAPRSAVNWVAAGATTPVKDQGQCGSCWAFSAVEQIESMWYLTGNKMTEFSPQQLVSCDTVDGGCDGGDSVSAYEYVEKVGGLATEAAYPYTDGRNGRTSSCSKFKVAGGAIKSYEYMATPCNGRKCSSTDENMLQSNLNDSPASICVNADSWQRYRGGVMTADTCGANGYYNLDHCVQLTGYNTAAKTPYWIVRNSWADDWGEDCGDGNGGCIYLTMGENTCGVANEAMTVGF